MIRLGFQQSIEVVNRAGHSGVELYLHHNQSYPFDLTSKHLVAARKRFETLNVRPPYAATASYSFTPSPVDTNHALL